MMSNPLKRPLTALLIVLSIVFCFGLALPSPIYAWGRSGLSSFKDGLEYMEKGEYRKASESFLSSAEKLKDIRDYALLNHAKAQMALGNQDVALGVIQGIIENYPYSPLVKDARTLEVRIALTNPGEAVVSLVSSYVNDYPEEMEIKLRLAELLERLGRTDEAIPQLREVYIDGGEFSESALLMIPSVELEADELLKRGANLLRNKKHEEAEVSLSEALRLDNGLLRKDILEKLGLALFYQKKYSQAAEAYLEAGRLYSAARSFLRAGDTGAFENAMAIMKESGDEDAIVLMLSKADDLRRNSQYEDALEILDEIIELFPSGIEDALWLKGWTYYTYGDLRNAIETFDHLCTEYPSNKYLYWKARTLERYGEDATDIFSAIDDTDYYGFLARMKTGIIKSMAPRKPIRKAKTRKIKRVDTLIELGLYDEAALELETLAGRTIDGEELHGIALRLKDIHRYREAMLLGIKLPDTFEKDTIYYPLAYWKVVKDFSSMYSLDPYLLLSVMREESRFDRKAVSSSGAMGLMQLMPTTAEYLSEKLEMEIDNEESLFDVQINVHLGSYYLKNLIARFKSVSAALAAYNAGDGRVKQWLSEGGYESNDEFIEDIPFNETRNYIKRIIKTYFIYKNGDQPRLAEGVRIL